MMRLPAVLLLLLLLLGCGGTGDLAHPQPIPIPAPQPGSNPATIAPTTLRMINESSVSAAEFGASVGKINVQITLDLNPRWGTNGSATTDPGPGPTIRLQARESGPGGYTQGGLGFVAYRENTRETWPAYMSHVAINLLTHDLAGQSVEAFDYHVNAAGEYVESAPWQLADFDFPSNHGLGGTYYDHAGRPAYDLLHKLTYP